ncbi:hypothetical protein [Pseudomarimonas arenosa]|uniref:Uncharacterized protein n=1 Tax=Pseudomarimonas arenosa TaxID=2774145 RepID=A0AAW3ZHM1_9GAMM|nr:hypothetical protein [Pseudomarimonas arenosa]MBD8524622.1 hypothetical protein [Pseudomarimonas arenosa]
MIHIVCGPSCAGKSTYIGAQQRADQRIGLPNRPVVFPFAATDESLTKNCFYHYNILRSAAGQQRRHPLARPTPRFCHDEAWQTLLAHPAPKQAVVIVTAEAELRRRMSTRRWVEPDLIGADKQAAYPNDYWLALIDAIEPREVYAHWLAELRRQQIPYTLVRGDLPLSPLIDPDSPQHGESAITHSAVRESVRPIHAAATRHASVPTRHARG